MNLTLKEFIVKLLPNYNCGADSDALADYITALIDSKDILELQDELQHERQGKDLSENEVELDYEEEEEDEVVTFQPQRVLREYSPERRGESREPSVPKQKQQVCTNFSRYGNCRFGNNCRYPHVTVNPRRKSTRVILSNLPPSVLSPSSITEVMQVYGSVVGVTVYRERGVAVVQYSTGEEASAALEAKDCFEGENVIIEIEPPTSTNITTTRPSPTLPHKKTNFNQLQSLISLQKQQQSLLETNLTSQQSLLTHLQNPALTVEEKVELMATLKRVQESLMGLQEMVKRTAELVVEAANSDYANKPVRSHPERQISRRHNTSSNRYTSITATTNNNNATPYYNPFKSNNTISTFNVNKFTLDLRPTTLKLTPLSSTAYPDIRSLQSRFSPYGLIQSLILTDSAQTALIKYQKHADAVKALEGAAREFEGLEGVEFKFIKQE